MVMNFTISIFLKILSIMQSVHFPTFNSKAKQVSCLESLLLNQDVIAVFPTGYGKSFIFHALPNLFPQKMTGCENIVIVVCPLNSIVKDQINVLASRGISAGVLRTSVNVDTQSVTLFNDSVTCNAETNCQIPDKILNGEYKILFCHPEAILSKEGRRLMKSNEYQKRMAAWVIDEAHCIKIW